MNATSDGVDVTYAVKLMQASSHLAYRNQEADYSYIINNSLWLGVTWYDVVVNVTSDGVDVTYAVKLMQTSSYVASRLLKIKKLTIAT